MEKVSKWDDVGFLISSNYRRKVLELLDVPKTPSQLSKELDINIAHVSRALSELEEKRMAKCLNPNAVKGRIYMIESYGRAILKEMRDAFEKK